MSYQGLTVPLPLGVRGLQATQNFVGNAPDSLILANNISFEQGGIARCGGSARLNAAAISAGLRALFDWWPEPLKQRILANTVDGRILWDEGYGAFATTMKSGLHMGWQPVWVGGGAELIGRTRKAFCFTGFNPVQVVEGDAIVTRDIAATKAADWTGTSHPTTGVVHGSRLWAGMGDRVYFSTASDHEDFQGAGSGSLSIGPGVGLYIQGMASFKNLLFVWKYPAGLYLVDDSSTTVTQWTATTLTESLGLAGPLAFAITDDNILFVSQAAHLHSLTNVKDVDITNSDLTAAADLTAWVRDNVDTSAEGLKYAQAVFYPTRREVHVAVRGKLTGTNSVRVIVDLNNPDIPRVRTEDKDVCQALALRRDAKRNVRLMSGDATGLVWLLDDLNLSKAGAAYTSEFQTPHDDFSALDGRLSTMRKNLKWIEVLSTPTGSYSVSFDVYLDGTFKYTITVPLSTETGSAIIGSTFIIGTGALGGTVTAAVSRRRLYGSARRISFKGRVTGAGQDFRLHQLVVGCTLGDERPAA